MGSKRKRLPIEQLRAAGRTARDMLVEKGILAKESILDKIAKDKDAPMLPGIPDYLPRPWTLDCAQQIMYDLLVMWKAESKGDPMRVQDITEFFKFVVSELHKVEKTLDVEKKNMPEMFMKLNEVPFLKDIFSPMRKHENLRAIHRFFVDSFAVAIVLKETHTTSEFADWFLTWTDKLRQLWATPEPIKEGVKEEVI